MNSVSILFGRIRLPTSKTHLVPKIRIISFEQNNFCLFLRHASSQSVLTCSFTSVYKCFCSVLDPNSKLVHIKMNSYFVKMYQNQTNSSDFFEELYQNRSSKIVIMIISTILTPVNVLLLYSVIWFEHYGSDLKRTLINKAVTSMCWCGLVQEVLIGFNLLRWSFLAVLIFGILIGS